MHVIRGVISILGMSNGINPSHIHKGFSEPSGYAASLSHRATTFVITTLISMHTNIAAKRHHDNKNLLFNNNL